MRSRTLADGKELIRDILRMNGHEYEASRLKLSEVENELEAFPYNPGIQRILDKNYSKPRKRPLVNVRFRYAYATIQGLSKPIYLYSRSDYLPDALIQ